ncbi:MAG TPA: hypothetical protein VK165_11515 [Azonexus sp.]|nr:hypothetical protein [Azonexus sp.]
MSFPPITYPDQSVGSHYVNLKAARQAIEFATPLLEAGLTDPNVVGSGFLYIVIMNPGLRPGQVAFEEAILHEHAFGERQRWDADYAAFARAKARSSWLSGMDSYRLQELSPHLLRDGDTLLAGGVWLDGIVVGVSGAFPCYDEVYANTIAAFLRALAREARQAELERPVLQAMRPELIRS